MCFNSSFSLIVSVEILTFEVDVVVDYGRLEKEVVISRGQMTYDQVAVARAISLICVL